MASPGTSKGWNAPVHSWLRIHLPGAFLFLFATLIFFTVFALFDPRSSSAAQSGGTASYTISGSVAPPSDGSGAIVSLSGPLSASATVDSSGHYTLRGLVNGRYALTPGKEGYSFVPSSEIVTVNNSDVTGVDFTVIALKPTYSISGSITPVSAGAGATVTLSGAASFTTTADASGNFSFSGLSNGSYTVTPSKHKAVFGPVKREVAINQANAKDVNFTCGIRGTE